MSEQERLISTALAAVAVSKSFSTSARRLVVLNRVSLKIAHGSFTALIGPSGCGKTTLLKILAGIIPFDSGEIVFGGKMGSLGGQVAYMPQSDTLLPWRTALANALIPAQIDHRPRGEAIRETRDLFARFGLSGFEDLYPVELSGGVKNPAAELRGIEQQSLKDLVEVDPHAEA